MLQGEHSAVLLTCIKLSSVLKNQFLVFLRVAGLDRFYCIVECVICTCIILKRNDFSFQITIIPLQSMMQSLYNGLFGVQMDGVISYPCYKRTILHRKMTI